MTIAIWTLIMAAIGVIAQIFGAIPSWIVLYRRQPQQSEVKKPNNRWTMFKYIISLLVSLGFPIGTLIYLMCQPNHFDKWFVLGVAVNVASLFSVGFSLILLWRIEIADFRINSIINHLNTQMETDKLIAQKETEHNTEMKKIVDSFDKKSAPRTRKPH